MPDENRPDPENNPQPIPQAEAQPVGVAQPQPQPASTQLPPSVATDNNPDVRPTSRWYLRKVFLTPVIALVLIGAGLFAGWQYVKAQPQYSMYKIYEAINNRDYTTFKQYVDMESVIDTALAESMEANKSGADSELAQAFISLLMPAMKDAANTAIKKSVESGEFQQEFAQDGIMGYATAKVVRNGKVATITLTSDKKSTDYKMRDMGGYWQIFEMELDKSTFASMGKETEAKTINATFGKRQSIGDDWFMTVGVPQVYQSTNEFSQPQTGHKYMAAQVLFENTSSTPSSYSVFDFKLKDTHNQSFNPTYFGGKEPELSSGGNTVEPGGKEQGYITFDVLEDSSVQSVIYSSGEVTVVISE